MRRSWLVGAGVLTLAATALLLLPSVSQAQRRGGWGRGWNGGWGGGYGYGGYGGYGYDGFGYGRGGWGSPYYGGYNGFNRGWYSPNVYNYDSAPSYSYDSGNYYNPPAGETYYGGGAFATDQSNMTNQPMPQQEANKALIVLRVPSNAQVFFEGQPTTSQGTVRAYLSPPIDPNKEFTYDVKATWDQNGRPVTQERHVRVHAGRQARLDFMQAQGGQPAYGAGPGMENEEFVPAPRSDQGVLPDEGTRNREQHNAPNDRNRANPTSPTGNQNTPGTNTVPPAPGSSNQNRSGTNPNPSNP